jgi:hypothetical protein
VLSRFTKPKERQIRLLLVESRRRLQPRIAQMNVDQIVRSLRRGSYG